MHPYLYIWVVTLTHACEHKSTTLLIAERSGLDRDLQGTIHCRSTACHWCAGHQSNCQIFGEVFKLDRWAPDMRVSDRYCGQPRELGLRWEG